METAKRRALGRGLEELFSTEVLDFNSFEEKIVNETPKDEIVEINVNELRTNPYQPRKVFDEDALEELANSIKERGVFQPIIVKKSIKGYEIIAGERRVRASRMAGKEKIPAIIRDFNDNEMMEIALLENLQRENLNSIEEALAYVKIMDAKGLTHDELAKVVGKSQSYIANIVGLLRLPDEVKDMLVRNKISTAHARILSKMSDRNTIINLANRIVDEGINVRELEEISRDNGIAKRIKVERKNKNDDLGYKYIEESLCEKYGTKVHVSKNKIEFSYNNIDDLNRIIDLLKKEQ